MNSITEKNIRNFWGKVDKEKSQTFYNGTRCWEWMAYCNLEGYGHFDIGGRDEKAHRVSWVITNGEIQNNLQVLHRCDNPSCVNPAHLFLGTEKDNAVDRKNKGRGKSGEEHGRSKLTWEQVREIRRCYKPFGIGGDSSIALSKKYLVGETAIRAIINNETWRE